MSNMRQRATYSTQYDSLQDTDSDDYEEVDPEVLRIYSEPLDLHGDDPYTLPYNRRILW